VSPPSRRTAEGPQPRESGSGAEAAPRAARRGALHAASVAVFTIVVALALGLTIASTVSISEAKQRYLDQQVREVSSALQAAVAAIQQPLITSSRIASKDGVAAFRVSAQAEMPPFSSMSLWRVANGHAVLITVVVPPGGPPPALLDDPAAARRFIASVPASSELTVTALFGLKVRGLGYAERLSPSEGAYVVYGETSLPLNPFIGPEPAGSPFAGLDFALYFGRAQTLPTLMFSTVSLPPKGRSTSEVVPFASAVVTVLSVLLGRPPGALPPWVPFAICGAGLALALLAAALTERLVRRRESAETEASERGEERDTQRDIAQTLQHALLPEEHPTFPGVEMATRYVAGVTNLDVGGDWFDAIAVDEHHLFFTVGDVSGRGLGAATVMGSLRSAIRAYAVQGDAPAEVLRKLDGLVSVGRDGYFATVVCVLLDVAAGRATIASAGHTPALLVTDRGPSFVDAPPNTPVGVVGPRAPRSVEVQLPAGAMLLAYTDGLVERRDQSLDEGLESLRSAPVDWHGPVESILAGVVEHMVPGGAHDDVAILAVRRLADAADATDEEAAATWVLRARQAFTRDRDEVPAARAMVLEAVPEATGDVRDALALLASELATNASLHARTSFEVAVRCDDAARRVRVEVTDFAGGEPTPRTPTPAEPRGRGLRILAATASAWGVDQAPGEPGKTVWFELGLEGPDSQGPKTPSVTV